MTSTTINPDLIAGYIEAAAQLIERDGLHCGDFYPQISTYVPHKGGGRPPWTRGTPGCTLTALVVAQYPGLPEVPLQYIEHFEGDPVVTAFARHLGIRDPFSIGAWSDDRQADEVIAELRACAAKLRVAA